MLGSGKVLAIPPQPQKTRLEWGTPAWSAARRLRAVVSQVPKCEAPGATIFCG